VTLVYIILREIKVHAGRRASGISTRTFTKVDEDVK
jgi:hypothetical protein